MPNRLGAHDPPTTSRRALLLASGAAASAAVGLAACGGGDDGRSLDRRTRVADLRIVNYVLSIEYLEAALYDKAIATGFFVGGELDILKRFRDHEHEHVQALTAAVGKLGGEAAERPVPSFPLDDRISILKAAQRLENLGAAAYVGQAAKIGDREILIAMLSIHSVEARHAATLNTILGKELTPTGAFAKPSSMEEVLPVLQLFIAA
jgi:hypothetical protein